MTEIKSKYACPNCGKYQLKFLPVKGEYGTYDTTKYICLACGNTASAEVVQQTGKSATMPEGKRQ